MMENERQLFSFSLPSFLYRIERRNFMKYFQSVINLPEFKGIHIADSEPLELFTKTQCGVFFVNYRRNARFDFLIDLKTAYDPNFTKVCSAYKFAGICYTFSFFGKSLDVRFLNHKGRD